MRVEPVAAPARSPHRAAARSAAARSAAALAALLLLAALSVLAPAAPARAAGTPPALPEGTMAVDGPVALEVDQVGASSSAVLRRGEPLALRLRASDSSGGSLRGLRVLVSASSRALTSSAALQRWAQGQGPSRGDVVLEDVGLADLAGPSPLPAPAQAAAPPAGPRVRDPDPVVVDVSADPEQTRRLGSTWGPRGLTVEVVDAEGTRLAAQRTFVTWLPSGEAGLDGRVALVVPLSAGAPDIASAEVPPQRLQALVAPGGRLDRVLAVAALPGASWAVDPAVLGGPPDGAAPQRAEQAGAPAPQETGEEARVAMEPWRERLAATAAGHDVALLPFGSPDVVGLTAAGAQDLYALAQARGRASAGVLDGSTTLTRTTETTLTAAAVRTAAQGGRDVVLLAAGDQGDQGPRVDLRARATGQDGVGDGAAATVSALVPSAAATRVLVEGTTRQDPQDPAAVARPTPAMTSARLVAESAVATLARGDDGPGTLLMAPSPGWDVDPVVAGAVLGPVQAAPWARPVGLDALAASPGTPRAAGPASAQRGQLPAEGLVAVRASLARASAGAAALSTPDGYLEASQASAAAAAASAWEEDLGAWQAGVDAFARSSSRVAEQVRVVPGSTVTVLASKVDLPVTVVNGFDRSVDVTVSLDSSSGRLQGAGDVPIVALAPGDRQRVLVPVTAVASGDVTAEVVLRARDGSRIGEPVRLDVVVRADWEDRGTVVAAAVVALVLLVGVVRTVRRNRRGGRARPGRGGAQPPGGFDDGPDDRPGHDGGGAGALSGAGSSAGGRR